MSRHSVIRPVELGCPACRRTILFEPFELDHHDHASTDVMCASCGAVTRMRRLTAPVDRHSTEG